MVEENKDFRDESDSLDPSVKNETDKAFNDVFNELTKKTIVAVSRSHSENLIAYYQKKKYQDGGL